MKLIKTLICDWSFDVSIWLTNKGYRLYDDYYSLGLNENVGRYWSEIWLLKLDVNYAIIKQIQDPFKLFVIDLEGKAAKIDGIIYYLTTVDQPKEKVQRIDISQDFNYE